jgi:hypothetical protein
MGITSRLNYCEIYSVENIPTNHFGCRVVVHFAMITDQLMMSFLHVIEVIVEDHDIAAAAHLSDNILL